MSFVVMKDKNWLRGMAERIRSVVEIAKLPLGPGRWSGMVGSVLGQGTGSSVDFHDHRPYFPGDDPRHINWQAYARTGSYSMKLYRQEVSPRVDVVFDGSASMFLTQAKARRSLELLYFCVMSGLRQGASVKVFLMRTSDVSEILLERVLSYDWELEDEDYNRIQIRNKDRALVMSEAPLRTGSLRVWISDVLFEEAPSGLVLELGREKGRGVILAPTCEEEAHPDWSGNVEFEDCESSTLDRRRVEEAVMRRYEQAYARHYSLWREECTRRGVCFGRAPAEGDFLKALRLEAVITGAVVMG